MRYLFRRFLARHFGRREEDGGVRGEGRKEGGREEVLYSGELEDTALVIASRRHVQKNMCYLNRCTALQTRNALTHRERGDENSEQVDKFLYFIHPISPSSSAPPSSISYINTTIPSDPASHALQKTKHDIEIRSTEQRESDPWISKAHARAFPGNQ
jgi:hypothetical protein